MDGNIPHGARVIDMDVLKGELQECKFCLKGSSAPFDDTTTYGFSHTLQIVFFVLFAEVDLKQNEILPLYAN